MDLTTFLLIAAGAVTVSALAAIGVGKYLKAHEDRLSDPAERQEHP